MSIRIVASAAMLVLSFYVACAQALGLGSAECTSGLNQPLKLRIPILHSEGRSIDDLTVSFGSPQEFENAGIRYAGFIDKIKLAITSDQRALFISASSQEPYPHPALSFVLNLQWEGGRLMRTYKLLVQLPDLSKEAESNVQTLKTSNAQSFSRGNDDPTLLPRSELVKRLPAWAQKIVDHGAAGIQTEAINPDSNTGDTNEESNLSEIKGAEGGAVKAHLVRIEGDTEDLFEESPSKERTLSRPVNPSKGSPTSRVQPPTTEGRTTPEKPPSLPESTAPFLLTGMLIGVNGLLLIGILLAVSKHRKRPFRFGRLSLRIQHPPKGALKNKNAEEATSSAGERIHAAVLSSLSKAQAASSPHTKRSDKEPLSFTESFEEIQLKLELSEQYLQLHDYKNARILINEALKRGNVTQQEKAQTLLLRLTRLEKP